MWTSRMGTHGGMPVRVAACAAALALLSVPGRASADGPQRTALLTLTDGTSLSRLAESVTALGGRVLQQLDLSESLLVELPHGAAVPAGAVEVPDVAMKVNGTRAYYEAQVPTYRQTILAPANTATGSGATVAIVDTGVADVPDLQHVRHVAVDGVGSGDGMGHGTFIAGLIGGRGTQFSGVAPGADLVDVKVADARGSTSLSKVLAGLELAAENEAQVVNLSLSTDSPLPPSFDPLTRALDALWESGVTVVVAAGNDGPDWGTVSSPGNDPQLLTVGALDEGATGQRDDDTVAEFSARGSVFDAKPDIVAPGVSLVSTAAPESVVVRNNRASLVDGGYMRGSGTSMSAAVVSGSVAAVIAANPDLKPNGVKALLRSTTYASEALEARDGAGKGALDLDAALAMAGSAATDPAQPDAEVPESDGGPAETDANAWAAFAEAWRVYAKNGDVAPVARAWSALAPQTKVWAARAWSMAVVGNGVGLSPDELEARAWSARAWSAEPWLARAWSARAWSARAWSYDEWLARAWSARAWSDEEWLARAWSARAWSGDDWAARAWSARAWSARAWSARAWSDGEWQARAWSARAWSARAWSARAWSARAWSARAWSEYTWEARAWSARAWSTDTWAWGR